MLARYLRERFEVLFLQNEQFAPIVSKEGFQTFDCAAPDAASILEKLKSFDFSWLNERDLNALYQAQLATIDAKKPFAVLGDAMPVLKMAAAKAGIPFVSLVNAYMSPHYARLRPLSRTHPVWPYLRKLPAALQHFLTVQGEAAAFRKIHRIYKKLRKRYRLAATKTYLEEWQGDLTLITDMQQLFPIRPSLSDTLSLPPLIYDDQGSPLKLNPGRKTIFVSMGSTGDWTSLCFLNEARFAEWQIITAGDRNRVLQAPHIQSFEFLPAATIMPQADLMICHGGNGTIYQAIYYGVPMLLKPAHFEQEWNAGEVERARAGEWMRGRADAGTWYERIRCWLEKGRPEALVQLQQCLQEEQRELKYTMPEILDRLIQLNRKNETRSSIEVCQAEEKL